ncbi:CHAT domain-containing protein [Calothrix sp. CCY 0018]|uniref:CHAT domain-containing protein n=1 Tax=Calothrix sp. CCY 0018 TaxID=3103864 RepID=UPI0039C6B8A6
MNIKKKLLKSISLSLSLAIITALLITIFYPVSAQENIGIFTPKQYSEKPLSKPLSCKERGFNSCPPYLVGKGLGVRFGSKKSTPNSSQTSLISENKRDLPQIQFEQGKILFEKAEFASSAEVWQDAAAGFERQGDKINQAWSLSFASLAWQNLGELQQAQTAIDKSLNLLQNQKRNTEALAVALNTQGSLKLKMGQANEALEAWKQAESIYTKLNDNGGKLGSQINQAQALQAMGFYRRSQKLLESVNQTLLPQPDSQLKVQGLQSLGVALQLVGDLSKSQEVLQQSLAISQRLSLDTSDILFSLGNTARDLKQTEAAFNYYQQAAANPKNYLIQVEARLNQLSLHLEQSQWQQAFNLLPQIQSQLDTLPYSRTSIYASVNLAKSLAKLMQSGNAKPSHFQDAARILARAIKQAETLKDLRAQAYALTQLGSLYEQTNQFNEGLKLSRQALQISQNANASDITYQAAWQVGRILKIQGKNQEAISAYDSSVKILKTLRSDLVAINRDVQFDFQESVEPVYREFVDILLQPESSLNKQENLKLARKTIEALQLAELDNFFREACLDAKPEQIDQIDKTAAVIYPIILDNRLEVIASLPGKPLTSYKTDLPKSNIEAIIRELRVSLNPAYSQQQRLKVYQQAYDWLIKPIETDLAASNIQTLAFVLDGSMRNIPMAALHDGKQYLVEKYSVALSPGLQLMQARQLKDDNLNVIAAGLSEARQGFKALPGVKLEVKEISNQVKSTLLINENFTDKNLAKSIKTTPFSVLHLATHGQFSSNSEETFILTWDGKINVKQLSEFLRFRDVSDSQPVELMVLSACQTAKGDKRAILGLAGVAVRSGARSTLATLWAVKDESTAKFMVEFYKQLNKRISKAEALRQAQITFLKDKSLQHPFYWAPFILVGNWI